MMDYAQIMDLVHVGFTPDQIMSLTNSGAIPSAPDAGPEETTPLPEASESPIKEGTDVPDPGQSGPEHAVPSEGDSNITPDPLDDIRETVRRLQAENDDLKKQIQSANIRDRTVQSVSVPDASATLAEIIRPTFHNNVEYNH